MKNIIINYNSKLKDVFISFNKTGKKFCLIKKNKKIIGIISDGDIIKAILNNYNLEDSILKVTNKNFKFLYHKQYNRLNILKIFLEEKILFIPILKDNNEIYDIIIKEEFYENILLQDKIKDDNIKSIYPRPWGFYKSIYLSKFARSKIISINPKQRLSLQKHKHREEHWIIINGIGKIILEDSEKTLKKGDYFFIPKGTKHRIENISEENNLYFVEVQLGDYFGEDDIIRYSDDYNRIT